MRLRLAQKVAVALAGALIGAGALAQPAIAQAARTFTVHFGENDAKITGEENRAALGAAIEAAQECGEASVLIAGHDDGAKADEISLARANAVHKAMVDAGGVGGGPGAFKIAGYGAKQPKAPGADGKNRRVEISIACK